MPKCDWCEGAGCEECQGAKGGGGGGGGGGVCEWCEGAGCDECGVATIHTGGKKPKAAACDWCGGEGCENCTGASAGGTVEPCGFCDGAGCDVCAPKAPAALSVDVEIANTFYEAEGDMKENPKKSLQLFQKVLDIAKGAKDLNDEAQETVFKAMVHMVVLLFKAGNEKDVIARYTEVMAFFPKVSHNESNKAVDTVLSAMMAGGKGAHSLRDKIYGMTVDQLSKMPNKGRMVFDIQMRRAAEFVAEKDYAKAQQLLKAIHQSCKTKDGQDDKTGKGSELIDIYALEMKIAFETKVKAKTKELYFATKDLRVDVKNPKSQAIIRECWGKMFGDDGQWPKAYAEFFVAFQTYQEAGQSTPAKKALAYVVIASMLAGTGLNPFDAREAAVFQKDEAMQPVINLRKAYERRDVPSFTKALAEFQSTADDWILSHMDSMIADFHKQYILKFVKPYRRLRVAFLANALQISEDICESYLVQLVLDGLIHAKIDQVNGLLDLTQRTGGGDKKYQALEGWASKLDAMSRNLPQPHSSAHMHPFL